VIEILLPIRNPTAVLDRTIESLLAQTDRGFTVLISDNFSRDGLDRIGEAARRLEAAGIVVRAIRPPVELGRVQHWNWLHLQSEAEWLKPLFVGDWLEKDCVREWRAAAAADPNIAFILFHFLLHKGLDGPVYATGDCGGVSGLLTPESAAELGLLRGNFLGGPVNVVYQRWAFQAAGGHQTSLPLTADYDLYLRLALQVSTFIIPKVLGHFTLHENRYAKRGSGTARESMRAELLLVGSMIGYAARYSGMKLPWGRVRGQLLALWWGWMIEEALRLGGRWKRALIGQRG
jgi:hypothetical protein